MTGKKKEEEMKSLSDEQKSTRYTLHKGPPLKHKELYQFLYQNVKDLRLNRELVTVDRLIGLAQEEDDSIKELSLKGKISLIRRFMTYFKLSIRETTGTSGFREEQASEEQKKRQR